jgi:homoserine dehydrogenase
MSGYVSALARRHGVQFRPAERIDCALIGSGQVASALAELLDARGIASHGLQLRQLCNRRGQLESSGAEWSAALAAHAQRWGERSPRSDRCPELAPDVRLVIDASASASVAAAHVRWLRQGRVVVTANKLALGEDAATAAAVLDAVADGARYGDSATVGAGLGAIARLRAFVACGEPVLEIAGVLSGSLAFLFERFDGRRAFAELVDEARALGLTESDPRQDVAGLDVARKLRILARAAGWQIDSDTVQVDPRLARVLELPAAQAFARLDAELDGLFRERPHPDARLTVVARARPGEASVALEWLARDDALAQRRGCENVVQIRTPRYAEHALLLRGPGAGPALTAAALVEDALRLRTPGGPEGGS